MDLGALYRKEWDSPLYGQFNWLSIADPDMRPFTSKFNKPLRFHAVLQEGNLQNPKTRMEEVLGKVGYSIFACNLIHEVVRGQRVIGNTHEFPEYFQYAKSLTQAELFVGDYRRTFGEPEKNRTLLELGKWLKPYGCEGVSVQIHRNIETPFPLWGLESFIKESNDAGLKVSFDECRVLCCQHNRWPQNIRYERQATYYRKIVRLAKKYNIPIGIWTPFDREDLKDKIIKKPPDSPGLWDKYGKPKPAYYALYGQ